MRCAGSYCSSRMDSWISPARGAPNPWPLAVIDPRTNAHSSLMSSHRSSDSAETSPASRHVAGDEPTSVPIELPRPRRLACAWTRSALSMTIELDQGAVPPWYPRSIRQPAKGFGARALAAYPRIPSVSSVLTAHRFVPPLATDQRDRCRGRRARVEPVAPEEMDSRGGLKQLVSTTLSRLGGWQHGGCSSVVEVRCDPECRGFDPSLSPNRRHAPALPGVTHEPRTSSESAAFDRSARGGSALSSSIRPPPPRSRLRRRRHRHLHRTWRRQSK